MAIVQTFQGGRGTSESTYTGTEYMSNGEVATGLGKVISSAASTFTDAFKNIRGGRVNDQDKRQLLTEAADLVDYLNFSPQEVDPSEKQEKVREFYNKFSKVYEIGDISKALEVQGGKELIDSAYEPLRDNAERYKKQQKELATLGYAVEPGASNDDAARVAGQAYLNNLHFIDTGIMNYQQASSSNAKAQSLRDITPAVLKVENLQLQNAIDEMGGLSNITSYQLVDLKNNMRRQIIDTGLPANYADYLTNIMLYPYSKVVEANDKEKDEAQKQFENFKKAKTNPYVAAFLDANLPTYVYDPKTGDMVESGLTIQGAQFQAAVDLAGKDNYANVLETFGGRKFTNNLIATVAALKVGQGPAAFQKSLGEEAAKFLISNPKEMNEALLDNPEGSVEDEVGTKTALEGERNVLEAIDRDMIGHSRDHSLTVDYINRMRGNKVTPSAVKNRRENLDSILDSIAREYKNSVFKGDDVMPLIDPETGSVDLYTIDKTLLGRVEGFGKKVEEGRIEGTSLTGAKTTIEPSKTARLISKNREALMASMKELARQSQFSEKEIYKAFNNAVSRATGITPNKVRSAILGVDTGDLRDDELGAAPQGAEQETKVYEGFQPKPVTESLVETVKKLPESAAEAVLDMSQSIINQYENSSVPVSTKPVVDDSRVTEPLNNYRVTEKFVKRDVVLTGNEGDTVHAPVNATVAYAGEAPGKTKGNVVILKSDADPNVTWTMSLKDGALRARQGDHVSSGDSVAVTGKSGSVRVMLKDGEKHINPMQFFRTPPVPGLPPDRQQETEEEFNPDMLRAFDPSMLRR